MLKNSKREKQCYCLCSGDEKNSYLIVSLLSKSFSSYLDKKVLNYELLAIPSSLSALKLFPLAVWPWDWFAQWCA